MHISDEPAGRDWLALGRRLAEQRSALSLAGSRHMWEVGDWLVHGENRALRRLKRDHVRRVASGVTGYACHTLKLAAIVSRRVDPEIRVDGLTWWHHVHVAWLDREQQAKWLVRAAEEGWSASRLRERLLEAGLIRRRSNRIRAQKLLAEVTRLTRAEIPDDVMRDLGAWWQRICGATPTDILTSDRHASVTVLDRATPGAEARH